MAPESAGAQGATQWASTQTVPPKQSEVLAHTLESRLQTPRFRSHSKPIGQGDAAEQWGVHSPSTHDWPPEHWVPSEQSPLCSVQSPFTQRAPPPPHSPSKLQGMAGTTSIGAASVAPPESADAASRVASLDASKGVGAPASVAASGATDTSAEPSVAGIGGVELTSSMHDASP